MRFAYAQYKQKGFAPILIVLLVAVLAVGGYFVYTNYSNNQTAAPTGQTTQTPPPTPDETVYTEASESANWKIYQGKSYTFKYPANVNKIEGQSTDGVSVSHSWGDSNPPYFEFKVGIENNTAHLTTRQVIEKLVGNIRNSSAPWAKSTADQYLKTMKQYTNGEISGVKLQCIDEGYPGDSYDVVIEAFPDKIFRFWINNAMGGCSGKEYEKLLDQILSTFKFLP